jgi:hypothetical protein
MAALKRLVLDVLKPHEPPLVDFTDRIAETESVAAVTASLIELDQEVQNVKLTVEGDPIDLDSVEGTVDTLGATIHSVDEVACGEYAVTDRRTLQDP